MNIDELLAREAIRYTLALYNNTGDRGAKQETAQCFCEDGVLELREHGGTHTGREAIEAFLTKVMEEGMLAGQDPKPTRHHLSTSRIELTSPTTADGWTYFQLVRSGQIIQTGIYIDKFAQVGERWLIKHRRLKLEFMAED